MEETVVGGGAHSWMSVDRRRGYGGGECGTDIVCVVVVVGGVQKQEETFSVEFSHAQLYDMFLDLEKIQEQLDHLS